MNLDIERLIIGTMGIQQPETITELSEEYGSDRIMISLDSKDNKVVIKGWQEKIDKVQWSFHRNSKSMEPEAYYSRMLTLKGFGRILHRTCRKP